MIVDEIMLLRSRLSLLDEGEYDAWLFERGVFDDPKTEEDRRRVLLLLAQSNLTEEERESARFVISWNAEVDSRREAQEQKLRSRARKKAKSA